MGDDHKYKVYLLCYFIVPKTSGMRSRYYSDSVGSEPSTRIRFYELLKILIFDDKFIKYLRLQKLMDELPLPNVPKNATPEQIESWGNDLVDKLNELFRLSLISSAMTDDAIDKIESKIQGITQNKKDIN